MDYSKHVMTDLPTRNAEQHLLRLAVAVAVERGAKPTHWSRTDLGLDSAPCIGLMLWDDRQAITAIDPSGHMYWFAPPRGGESHAPVSHQTCR